MLAAYVTRPLNDIDGPVLELLRLGAYQIHYMDSVPPYAAVSATVDQVRQEAGARPTGFANAVLRRIAGAPAPEPPAEETPEALAAWGSHPQWLVRRWLDRYPIDAVRTLMEANNRRPPTCLLPLGDPADAARLLAEAGIETRPAAPWSRCLVLGERSRVREALEIVPASIVQDPASNLVARFADVPPGTIVADLCAAPGGKSLALSDRAARIIAADRSEPRMGLVRENLLRTGRRAALVVADAARPPFRPVDCVLLDAPCTGTATLARHPDARWRLTPVAIDEMAGLQERLLDAAAEVVRPGGLLVYSTCTLEPEENEERVEHFLATHDDFSMAPGAFGDGEPDTFVDPSGYLRVMPWDSGYDGAFCARLRKNA